MRRTERPLNLRLLDILNEAERCKRWLEGVSLQGFLDDDRLQYAVERSLQIVSEASRYVPAEMQAEHPDVNWRAVVDFGNLSRHGYHEVGQDLIYRTAVGPLRALKLACDKLYAKVKGPSDPWPDAS